MGNIRTYSLPNVAKPTKPYKIVVLMAHRTDSFTQSAAQAAIAEGRKYGADVAVQDAGGYQNVQKQISQIETAVTQHPDAIVMFATDPKAIVPALEKAHKAGIKVVGWIQEPAMKNDFVVTEHYDVDGNEMATALFKRMGGKGKVMSVLGGVGSSYYNAMEKGFKEALAQFPEIQVVASKTQADFDPAKVQSAVEDQLVKTPDLGGVFTQTSGMAVGASQAIAAAGKLDSVFTVGEIVSGCDEVQALKDGRITILIGAPGYYLGQRVIADTVRDLEGQSVPALAVIKGNVYTGDNIENAKLADVEVAAKFLKGCS